MDRIVLASRSPRRRQLLEWAEIDFEVITEDTAETAPENALPEEAAVYIAREKAAAVAYRTAGRIVLAADTMVVLDSQIIGKPRDRAEAIDILHLLQGNHHQVVTGVVITGKGKEVAFHDSTDVEFHPLSRQQLAFYVDKYQPFDKAGAYAIQEWIGVVGIKSIRGDFYNVMGLPVSRVVRELRRFSHPPAG